MSKQIGIDSVDMQGLVQKVVDANRALYDAMTPEQMVLFRKSVAAQIETLHGMLEDERRKTINSILQIIDVVGMEKSPLLRAAIIKFRDEV